MSSSEEISLACADANSNESCVMVSVKVATVDLSAAVAVSKLARASTVSAWWFCTLVESTAFALGKCCPAVRRRFALHSRCALAKCTLKLGQVRSRSGKRFHSLRSLLNTPVFARQSTDMSTACFEVKGASPNSAYATPSAIFQTRSQLGRWDRSAPSCFHDFSPRQTGRLPRM